MKVLIMFAHPESASFVTPRAAGHCRSIQVSE